MGTFAVQSNQCSQNVQWSVITFMKKKTKYTSCSPWAWAIWSGWHGCRRSASTPRLRWVGPSTWTNQVSYPRDPWALSLSTQQHSYLCSVQVCMPKYVKGLFMWNHSRKDIGEEFPWGSSVDVVPEARDLEEDQQFIATNIYK